MLFMAPVDYDIWCESADTRPMLVVFTHCVEKC